MTLLALLCHQLPPCAERPMEQTAKGDCPVQGEKPGRRHQLDDQRSVPHAEVPGPSRPRVCCGTTDQPLRGPCFVKCCLCRASAQSCAARSGLSRDQRCNPEPHTAFSGPVSLVLVSGTVLSPSLSFYCFVKCPSDLGGQRVCIWCPHLKSIH